MKRCGLGTWTLQAWLGRPTNTWRLSKLVVTCHVFSGGNWQGSCERVHMYISACMYICMYMYSRRTRGAEDRGTRCVQWSRHEATPDINRLHELTQLQHSVQLGLRSRSPQQASLDQLEMLVARLGAEVDCRGCKHDSSRHHSTTHLRHDYDIPLSPAVEHNRAESTTTSRCAKTRKGTKGGMGYHGPRGGTSLHP